MMRKMIDSADSSFIVRRSSFQQKSPHQNDEDSRTPWKQNPFRKREGAYRSVALSSSSRAAGIGTLMIELRVSSFEFEFGVVAAQLKTQHSELRTQNSFQGCRGFIGPVPPPLWIRAAIFTCRWKS